MRYSALRPRTPVLLSIALSLVTTALAADGLYATSADLPELVSVIVGEVEFGARGDERGPIGGGAGCAEILTGGDHSVRSAAELVAVLELVEAGEVVFFPGDAEIDLTARVHIEGLQLVIPGGVTLASDRGREGSLGALIFSDALKTQPLLVTGGVGVRLTGLRLRGPDAERRIEHHRRAYRMGAESQGSSYYYKLPTSDGIRALHDRLSVDNCELAGWSHAAVDLRRGDGHVVRHSFLHHNQRQGLGYGVCLDIASATIERNLFDWNRHSIAGTGRPGCSYIARHNVERGESLSHCFDMHGGRDRKDGTDIAGTRIVYERNTFLGTALAIKIRGTPEESVSVKGCWFRHASVPHNIVAEGCLRVGANAYGLTEPAVIDGR